MTRTTVVAAKIIGKRGWRVEKSVVASLFGLPEDREFEEKNAFWDIL